MKETLKSPVFAVYCLAISALTITFFVFLHRAIEARQWHEYFFAVFMYPAAMYGFGAFFGPFVKTRDYVGEGKAFHLAAFVVVNLVQAVWIVAYAPKNLVWWPMLLVLWGAGLFIHLRSTGESRYNRT